MMQRQPLQPGLTIGKFSYKPLRTFTKRMIIANNVMAWIGIFLSMYRGEGVSNIAIPALAMLLVALCGVYSGVGHLDLRAIQAQPQGYGYGGYGGHQTDLPQSEPFNPGDQ